MPKKKSSSKKVVTKKSSSRKSTAMNMSASQPSSKGYLVAEQEAFHRDHPNAEMLIKIFLIAFIILVILYFKKYSYMY